MRPFSHCSGSETLPSPQNRSGTAYNSFRVRKIGVNFRNVARYEWREKAVSPGEEARARNRKKGREEKRFVSPSLSLSLRSLFSRAFSGATTSPKTTTTTTTREDAGRRAERWRKRETTKILGLFRNSISVRRPSDAPTRSSPRHAHASVHEHATSRASLPSPSLSLFSNTNTMDDVVEG